MIHGGGWRSFDKQHFAAIAAYLAEHGFAAASIDYRLLPEVNFPDNIMDCKAAVRWVRANAKQYGFDPQRIGAIGGSAGGHLVCMLGTSQKIAKLEGGGGNPGVSSQVQAVVSMAGPTDMSAFARATGSTDKELLALISPITHVDADSAPTLFLHSAADKVVPLAQSESMAEKLKLAGVYAEVVKDEGGHDFWNQRAGFDRQMPVALKFFEKFLGCAARRCSSQELVIRSATESLVIRFRGLCGSFLAGFEIRPFISYTITFSRVTT